MSKVGNWQLGREMEFPYEGARPARQIAYVFDTNKCIACQTCSIACKTTWTSGKGQEHVFYNNVESKPYGFFPHGWDVHLLEKLGTGRWSGGTYEGKTVFEAAAPNERVLGYAPDEADYASPNLGEDVIAGTIERGAFFQGIHRAWMFYLARICNHCTYPACLAACPRKAIYKRPEDGIVLIDQSRCRGYRECLKACPYKKVFYNAITRVSEKCIGCYPLIERGEQPQCVQTCIGKIRLQGFLSPPGSERADNPLDYLVRIRKVALPLYPQFGTEPNVYYVPPLHVPRDFLAQAFGPGVEEAAAAYRSAPTDRELLGALLLFGNTPRILHRFRAEAEEAIGYDAEDREVVRVPYTEPFFAREFFDRKNDVYRHNVT
ncbi:MAG: dehydrogenase [Deltaproteobacteria bacterium]|nr:dehydrogenase [Deltaproteobacteria bacterium]